MFNVDSKKGGNSTFRCHPMQVLLLWKLGWVVYEGEILEEYLRISLSPVRNVKHLVKVYKLHKYQNTSSFVRSAQHSQNFEKIVQETESVLLKEPARKLPFLSRRKCSAVVDWEDLLNYNCDIQRCFIVSQEKRVLGSRRSGGFFVFILTILWCFSFFKLWLIPCNIQTFFILKLRPSQITLYSHYQDTNVGISQFERPDCEITTFCPVDPCSYYTFEMRLGWSNTTSSRPPAGSVFSSLQRGRGGICFLHQHFTICMMLVSQISWIYEQCDCWFSLSWWLSWIDRLCFLHMSCSG